MIFVETPIFTAQLRELLTDDEYSEFQKFLIRQPDVGDMIRGAGGLRKVCRSARGKGKSTFELSKKGGHDGQETFFATGRKYGADGRDYAW